jgi:hypothetical protein
MSSIRHLLASQLNVQILEVKHNIINVDGLQTLI